MPHTGEHRSQSAQVAWPWSALWDATGDRLGSSFVSSYLTLPDGQNVPLRDGLTIGRVAGCDIVLDDAKASRRHARLCVEGGVVEIEDLGSSNGTLLNGKPVQRRLLRDGDEVQIGAKVIVFHTGAPDGKAAAADDVDLFGAAADDLVDLAPPAARPVPPPSPAPSPTPVAPRATPSPPRPPSRSEVIEFADEVIAVRPPARPAAGVPKSTAGVALQQKSRTLQFSANKERGALGDDLAQMSGGARLLLYGVVLTGAVGIAWALIAFLS